ncbi:MAG TPA: hypothetical protein VFJ85_09055 [Acidimicrobiales bacterium]|nr:hypothetical protein [Acidimicrobiales bacterium]
MSKKVLYVLGGAAAVLFLMPGISAATDTFKDVFVQNDTAHPVPVAAQGTTQVGGTVNVGGTVSVGGSVDVRTGPEARTPYEQTKFFNQDNTTCTQFVCTVTFPAVPAGQRLVVTYASARWALTTGGTGASLRLTNGGTSDSDRSILLPAPTNLGFTSMETAGPVTFYVEAGRSPTLEMTGQFVQPVSNTAEAAVVGYLVPTS